MNPTTTLGTAELGYLVGSPTGLASWLCVIVPEEQLPSVIERATNATKRAGAEATTVIDASGGPLLLARGIIALPPRAVFLFGFETFSDDDWRHLDSLRSGLEREQPVVLFMTESSAAQLSRFAPNLASWIGGNYTGWDGAAELLSVEERAARLDVLRDQFGMTDAMVIQAASEHRLIREPQMSEWLVLLGRGDLLEHG